MKLLVLCASVLWCLVIAQESRFYHPHSLPNTRTLQNDRKLDVFLQNQRDTPSQFRSESQFPKHTGGHTHEAPIHTDQARHIIHFPQHSTHASAGETNKDTDRTYKDISFDRTKFRDAANEQTERHNTQGFHGFRNTSRPNDLKLAENGQNTFQIHSIGQPKVTRTVYINGVKVENNSEENVASIITALLNPHLQTQHTSTAQNQANYDSRGSLNVNPLAGYNHQNGAQVPSYLLGHFNNYKQDSEYSNGQSNNYNQIPAIDVRMGHHFGNGKLAMLREKGRHVKNATSGYNKRHVNQNKMQAQDHRVAEDGIIFV